MAISSSAEAAVDKNLEGVDKSRDLVKKARNDTKKNDSFHSKLEQMKMWHRREQLWWILVGFK